MNHNKKNVNCYFYFEIHDQKVECLMYFQKEKKIFFSVSNNNHKYRRINKIVPSMCKGFPRQIDISHNSKTDRPGNIICEQLSSICLIPCDGIYLAGFKSSA